MLLFIVKIVGLFGPLLYLQDFDHTCLIFVFSSTKSTSYRLIVLSYVLLLETGIKSISSLCQLFLKTINSKNVKATNYVFTAVFSFKKII